ncbi:hypothetical protein D4764_15G0008500 [Takifugu flavidus]|uniref:Uncharacterized protein n=1 Tax=Takifugu flavidus TaxID=433684 RepID=A0A5C6P2Z1_9TELE|nr:hypothetical protein D4764_15G0008500 [Takifugu flavidus]
MFKTTFTFSIQEYAESVSGYIQKCMEDVTIIKNIYTRANEKPWMTSEICMDPADVRRTLRKVNIRKAVGPDNIPGKVLKECADQMAGVLTDIFNSSLHQAVVPSCFKTATIIPLTIPVCLSPNHSTEDAIFSALHQSLQHLDWKNAHVRMLFLDFRNTIIPQHDT